MHITTALSDGEFEPLKGKLGATDLNAAAVAEHVPKIERQLQFVNECYHVLLSTLPY